MARIARPLAARPPRSWPRPQLEVRDLELVLALAEAGSTAGAAAQLHITQSAVSRALAQAEDRVGAALFARGARGVSPTAAGARLVAGAGALLAQLCELERQAAAPAAAPRRVRIVCECYMAYRWLPSALAALHARLPGLQVEIATEHTHEPARALARGDVDIALLTTSTLPRAPQLRQRPLFADEVVFVLAADHPLAAARAIGPADLRAHALVSSPTPPAEQRWFRARMFGRQRPRLRVLRFPITEAIIDAARARLGVAVLSEWIASGYVGPAADPRGELVVRRAAGRPLLRPWRIAYHRDAADAAERLVTALVGAAPRLRA